MDILDEHEFLHKAVRKSQTIEELDILNEYMSLLRTELRKEASKYYNIK